MLGRMTLWRHTIYNSSREMAAGPPIPTGRKPVSDMLWSTSGVAWAGTYLVLLPMGLIVFIYKVYN